MKRECRLIGWFIVRPGGACPPGRYALDDSGHWSGPDDSTVAILDTRFRLDRYADPVAAAARQFDATPIYALESLPA